MEASGTAGSASQAKPSACRRYASLKHFVVLPSSTRLILGLGSASKREFLVVPTPELGGIESTCDSRLAPIAISDSLRIPTPCCREEASRMAPAAASKMTSA